MPSCGFLQQYYSSSTMLMQNVVCSRLLWHAIGVNCELDKAAGCIVAAAAVLQSNASALNCAVMLLSAQQQQQQQQPWFLAH
jgi:hypothetical protein